MGHLEDQASKGSVGAAFDKPKKKAPAKKKAVKKDSNDDS